MDVVPERNLSSFLTGGYLKLHGDVSINDDFRGMGYTVSPCIQSCNTNGSSVYSTTSQSCNTNAIPIHRASQSCNTNAIPIYRKSCSLAIQMQYRYIASHAVLQYKCNTGISQVIMCSLAIQVQYRYIASQSCNTNAIPSIASQSCKANRLSKCMQYITSKSC